VATKQILQAAQCLADRLSNARVRSPCLRSLLQRSAETEEDVEAYMHFSRATDLVGLCDLSLAADLAKELVSQGETDDLFSPASRWAAGVSVDLDWAGKIWDGCHGGPRDMVDFGGFVMFMHGVEGAMLANTLYMATPRPRSVTKESLTPKGREERSAWVSGYTAAEAAEAAVASDVDFMVAEADEPTELTMKPVLPKSLSDHGRELYSMGSHETKEEEEPRTVWHAEEDEEETKGEWGYTPGTTRGAYSIPTPPFVPPPTPPPIVPTPPPRASAASTDSTRPGSEESRRVISDHGRRLYRMASSGSIGGGDGGGVGGVGGDGGVVVADPCSGELKYEYQ